MGREVTSSPVSSSLNQSNLETYAKAFRERNRHRRVPARNLESFCILFKNDLIEKLGLFDEEFESGKYAVEDYCLRVLNIRGYANYKKTSTIYTTIFLLEQLGDEYKRIAKHVIEDNAKYNLNALNFFDEVTKQFEAYHDLFYHFNLAKVLKVFEKEEHLSSTSEKLSKNASLDEFELYHHLKKITNLIISLVELAIDLRADTAFESNEKNKK